MSRLPPKKTHLTLVYGVLTVLTIIGAGSGDARAQSCLEVCGRNFAGCLARHAGLPTAICDEGKRTCTAFCNRPAPKHRRRK